MNKQILVIILSIMTGTVSYAQSFELGFIAGTSADLSCLADTGVDIATIIPTSSSVDFGIGTGLRFASPMYKRILKTIAGDKALTGNVVRKYSADIALPLFARFRYRFPSNFFLQTDAGYRFGLLSLHYGIGWAPTNGKECTFRGIFVEPQAGFRINKGGTISFGMTFQHYSRADEIQSFTFEQVSYSHTTVSAWSPIVFVRYSLSL